MDSLGSWDHFYSTYPRMDQITSMMSSFSVSDESPCKNEAGFGQQVSFNKSLEKHGMENNSNEGSEQHSILCKEGGENRISSQEHTSYEFPIENRSHTQTFSSSSSPLSSTDRHAFSPVFCDAELPVTNSFTACYRTRPKFYTPNETSDNAIMSSMSNFCNQFNFDNSPCSKISDSTLVVDGSSSDLIDKDHELEVMDILMQVRENSAEFSRKVFIGGVPEGMSSGELCNFFMRFGEVKVDWPHRKQSDEYPKGYAFLIFTSAEAVPTVINNCLFFQGRLCIQMEDSASRPKTVQVRPWRNADRVWKDDKIDAVTARYSVFLGGVPRTATACQLANLINGYIGNVVIVNIEVDIETEYPKGAARVVFSKRESYVTAIAKRHIGIFSSESQKEMEMKPFLEENMTCEHCNKVQTRNFCAELKCLLYICDKCWSLVHNNRISHEHKPMQKGSFFGKTTCPSEELRKPPARRVSSSSRDICETQKDRRMDNFTMGNYGYHDTVFSGSSNVLDNNCYMYSHDNAVDYSRKVFVGGLPEGLTADEICEFFSVFGHVTVDWPHRERSPHMPRAGYAFLVFASIDSVRRLISRCSSTPGKLCLKLTFPEIFVEKIVQIRPWCKSDRYWVSGKYRGSERFAIFMGGVPRTSTAAELAAFLFEEIGEVLSVTIEVESSTEYPKGAARAVFANREQYVYAIRLSQIAITSVDQQKTVELKPYLEESMVCEGCGQADTRNFCADIDCLVYLCELCWEFNHSDSYNIMHKPMLKGAFFPSRSTNNQHMDHCHPSEGRLDWEHHNRHYYRNSQPGGLLPEDFVEREWLHRRSAQSFCGKNTKRMMI